MGSGLPFLLHAFFVCKFSWNAGALQGSVQGQQGMCVFPVAQGFLASLHSLFWLFSSPLGVFDR